MDIRERYWSQDELLRVVEDAVQSRIITALPVKVKEDSEDGHTAQVESTVKSIQRMPDGTQKLIDMPTMPDAPVHFAGAGGITNTMPISKGDEGMVIIASRSVDVWHQQGDKQPQIDTRMHDLSDAMFLPGMRSTPRKLENVSKKSAQTRTDDHKTVSDWSHSAVTHAREQAVHTTNASGVTSALNDTTHAVLAAGVTAQKGGSIHNVTANTVESVAQKVMMNC